MTIGLLVALKGSSFRGFYREDVSATLVAGGEATVAEQPGDGALAPREVVAPNVRAVASHRFRGREGNEVGCL